MAKKITLKSIYNLFFRSQIILIVALALFLGVTGALVNLHFETEKREQRSSLTFSKASGATYAGTHTENLTFTIATRPSH